MAININELFADIMSTPEQRQDKLLQQGMLQGQLLSSGLKGRVANLAPLAQVAGQLGVQRNEDLRRAVQPMLGIDPRTTGEKLQEQIGEMDTSTPEGLLKAANSIQGTDPIRAAALRQAASDLRMQMEDREMAQTTEKMRQNQLGVQTASDIQRMRLATTQEERAGIAAEQVTRMSMLNETARGLEISERARQFIDDATRRENRDTFADSISALGTEYSTYAEGIRGLLLEPSSVMQEIARNETAKLRAANALEYKTLSKRDSKELFDLANERPELAKRLKVGFFSGRSDISEAQMSELAARYRMMNPSSTPSQQLDYVEAMIFTGVGAGINDIDIEAMAEEQAGLEIIMTPEEEEAAAAAAAANLNLAPIADPSLDPAFESVLNNLRVAGSDTSEATTNYLNRTKAAISSANTSMRNLNITNSDTSSIEQKIESLTKRLNHYSQ